MRLRQAPCFLLYVQMSRKKGRGVIPGLLSCQKPHAKTERHSDTPQTETCRRQPIVTAVRPVRPRHCSSLPLQPVPHRLPIWLVLYMPAIRDTAARPAHPQPRAASSVSLPVQGSACPYTTAGRGCGGAYDPVSGGQLCPAPRLLPPSISSTLFPAAMAPHQGIACGSCIIRPSPADRYAPSLLPRSARAALTVGFSCFCPAAHADTAAP